MRWARIRWILGAIAAILALGFATKRNKGEDRAKEINKEFTKEQLEVIRREKERREAGIREESDSARNADLDDWIESELR